MPAQEKNHTAIYQWLCEQTPQGGKVLDVGCGGGDLLALLVEERGVRGTGIEIDEACVVQAVQRGLSVHHGNAEEGMDHYADGSFDMVILSESIQEMRDPLHLLAEAFRISKQVLIVFPNFGYWPGRCQLALGGRAPRAGSLPHVWYTSPNRHYFTIADWESFCIERDWQCVRRGFLADGRRITFLPNLRAQVAMYLMESRRTA